MLAAIHAMDQYHAIIPAKALSDDWLSLSLSGSQHMVYRNIPGEYLVLDNAPLPLLPSPFPSPPFPVPVPSLLLINI